jgi:hypothetical protein
MESLAGTFCGMHDARKAILPQRSVGEKHFVVNGLK